MTAGIISISFSIFIIILIIINLIFQSKKTGWVYALFGWGFALFYEIIIVYITWRG